MNKLMLKRCNSCGAMVKIIENCNCKCGFECCGEKMVDVLPNSVDAAFEKHVPSYEMKDNKLEVRVNHVMEEDHYIEWIALVTDNKEEYVYLKPNEDAVVVFDDVSSGTIYSYCNKHGLWEKEI